ncbi:MAG TPA: tetratricopeptide repeat protein [Candidatus Binataceae bacterium]|nr:tetratricopeptide repeat protein [Candidatus Binataceae bacterium]
MRRTTVLTIWREDHIGDRVGGIFLDLEGEGTEAVFERLNEYLGAKVRLLKVDLMRERLTAEVDSLGLAEESSRLAAAARDLGQKGARRNAEPLFRQALALDPLNLDATLGLAALLVDLEQFDAALKMLRRAREIGGDTADVLRSLGEICVRSERVPSAIGYFQRAFELAPNDPAIRRALTALGRPPTSSPIPPSPSPPKENRPIKLVRRRDKR